MKNLFLSNYKLVFHLFQLLIFFVVFLVGGVNLFTSPLIGIFVLIVNYPVSNFLLMTSGINDLVKREMENLTKKEKEKQ